MSFRCPVSHLESQKSFMGGGGIAIIESVQRYTFLKIFKPNLSLVTSKFRKSIPKFYSILSVPINVAMCNYGSSWKAPTSNQYHPPDCPTIPRICFLFFEPRPTNESGQYIIQHHIPPNTSQFSSLFLQHWNSQDLQYCLVFVFVIIFNLKTLKHIVEKL